MDLKVDVAEPWNGSHDRPSFPSPVTASPPHLLLLFSGSRSVGCCPFNLLPQDSGKVTMLHFCRSLENFLKRSPIILLGDTLYYTSWNKHLLKVNCEVPHNIKKDHCLLICCIFMYVNCLCLVLLMLLYVNILLGYLLPINYKVLLSD